MDATMIRDPSTQNELTEEDLKLFNLLTRYPEHKAELELPLDYLKEEMHRGAINLNNLEILL
jgi:hypothetical protein